MRLWCSICYDKEAPEGSTDTWCTGLCGHPYHSACLEEWRSQAGNRKKSRYLKCPFCKVHCDAPVRLFPTEGPTSSMPIVPAVGEDEEEAEAEEEPMNDAQMARELRTISGEKRQLAEELESLKVRHAEQMTALQNKYDRKKADYATLQQQKDEMARSATTRDVYVDKLERKLREHSRRHDELSKKVADESQRANRAEDELKNHMRDVADGLKEAQNERDQFKDERDQLKTKADSLSSANANYRLKYDAKSAEIKKLKAKLQQLAADSQNQPIPSSSRKRQREDEPLHPTPRSSQSRQSSMAPPPCRSLGYTVNDRRTSAAKNTIDNSLFMDEDDAPVQAQKDWEPQSEDEDEEASFMFKEESFRAREVKVPPNSKLGLPSSFLKSKTLDLGPKVRPKLKVYK